MHLRRFQLLRQVEPKECRRGLSAEFFCEDRSSVTAHGHQATIASRGNLATELRVVPPNDRWRN